jgi:hypothetical protein
MRYILLLIAVTIIYIVISRESAISHTEKTLTEGMDVSNAQPTPANGAAPAPTAHTNAFKAPLDRTHDVLDQVAKQKKSDQF